MRAEVTDRALGGSSMFAAFQQVVRTWVFLFAHLSSSGWVQEATRAWYPVFAVLVGLLAVRRAGEMRGSKSEL